MVYTCGGGGGGDDGDDGDDDLLLLLLCILLQLAPGPCHGRPAELLFVTKEALQRVLASRRELLDDPTRVGVM